MLPNWLGNHYTVHVLAKGRVASYGVDTNTCARSPWHLSPPPQGLKRGEQSALVELFKTKVSITDSSAPPTSEKNRPTTMKKLEKLMRFPG